MKIAVGSDERTHLTDVVIAELEKRGHELVLFGPLKGANDAWGKVAQQVAESITEQQVDEGVLFCFTGTGAAIAANKVPGIRAALCIDAETARGARWWNDANILVMSLRATPETVAREILEAWFSEKVRPGEEQYIDEVRAIEQKYSR